MLDFATFMDHKVVPGSGGSNLAQDSKTKTRYVFVIHLHPGSKKSVCKSSFLG